MAMHDSRYGCEANTRTLVFVSGVQPLKSSKEFVRVGHVESRAVVPYEKFASIPSELDERLRCPAREFPRVADKVLQDSAHQEGLTHCVHSRCNGKTHISVRLDTSQVRD
ncbi:MAG TPA: hypothetical protein VIO32_07065, partial [Candidatus Baltobacteraceae bacterium]